MSEEFIQNEIIKQALGQISQSLLDEVMSVSTIRTIEAHTELVKEGQFVRVVPLVIKGLVKVYTHAAERELLLYYIQPQQSCILSFSSCLHNEKSNFTAVTDEASTLSCLCHQKR
jgi:CRP/FNR family transcriptional regulator, anaerobic regulatory protein